MTTKLGDEHMALVHSDGSECEDGCDAAPLPRGKHTPGPWATRENVDRNKRSFFPFEIFGTGTGYNGAPRVAIATSLPPGSSHEVAAANARLIAAAPTMLEALRDCAATLGRFHSETAAYKLACEALALAEVGES